MYMLGDHFRCLVYCIRKNIRSWIEKRRENFQIIFPSSSRIDNAKPLSWCQHNEIFNTTIFLFNRKIILTPKWREVQAQSLSFR